MSLIIGIDYTASNGPPNDPRRYAYNMMVVVFPVNEAKDHDR